MLFLNIFQCKTWEWFLLVRIELLAQPKRRPSREGTRQCLYLFSFLTTTRKVKLCLMEVVPGKKLRSWHHPFPFQWLPSSELALVSAGSRAERRWFPMVSTLLPGMLSAFGAWASASRSAC